MKEDILEQLATDFLESQGYFVRANLRYRPSKSDADGLPEKFAYNTKQDSVHSDIDIVAYHPLKNGKDKVIVMSCRSYQDGFNINNEWKNLSKDRKPGGRDAWRYFRELCNPKWSRAYRRRIEEVTGEKEFIYYLTVTKITPLKNKSIEEQKKKWTEYKPFLDTLQAEIRIIELKEMVDEMMKTIGTKIESSELGRTLQLLKAAGVL
ncbi:MAG TPA: hypothetical protein PLN26_15800 [Acidobacteriota bacterium]|nr:hypothetical protein [Acidobacteriota bacterium]HQG92975.1 hypothetical protein [Acidobacteriota bacterium]HQK86524.1 hypothetical protein [Acidobacteriota bacterium]